MLGRLRSAVYRGRERRRARAEENGHDARIVQELRDAQRERDMFLAMASHGLKTPLTAILGSLITVEKHHDRIPPDERLDLIAAARRRAQEIEVTIDRILGGYRAELAPQEQELSLRELMSEALLGFALVEGLEVGEIPDRIVRIDADAVQRVVGILVENAFSHSPPNSSVHVDVSEDEAGISIRVHNPGELPPQSEQADLFEAFRKGTTSKGIGLGLHIAGRLTTSLGGELSATADHGRVTFNLRVPVRASDSENLAAT